MGALAHPNCSDPTVRGPHRFFRGGTARPLSPAWRGMIPSTKGPPPTHSTQRCPVPAHPLCSCLQLRASRPTGSSTGAWAHKQNWGQGSPARPGMLEFPQRCLPPAGSPWVPGVGLSSMWCCGPLPAARCLLGSCTCERVFRVLLSHRAFHHNPVRLTPGSGGGAAADIGTWD